ncbi:ubiquitin carboxyl-terminal hydrolase-domain-containing protein [Tirmania nivea]|nr:ubiquitin carboxyl-terminal hydrolase-domain-containing protein [Tirmania nivea]
MQSLTRWRSIRGAKKRRQPFSADLYGGANKSGTKLTDEEDKIRKINAYLVSYAIDLPDAHDKIRDVLRAKYASGDVDKAVDLLILHDESTCGIVKNINRATRLLGAENNGKVTCYLDSLLFALFARLDSFEAMLYNIFDDEPRRRLSTMMRLFVNLLRTGRLVTTDIMQLLQDSIATCGWGEAASLKQQDASEAFTFITEKLDLPLLTLKMDVAHGGKEAADDDHRFVSERLLNLAIPDNPDGEPVKLEACLDEYFSNRIEVRRELERRQTIDSMYPIDSSKGGAMHIETADLGSSPISPAVSTPTNVMFTPKTVKPPPPLIRQATLHNKAAEALVPAWCFFSVLPFYTEGLPNEQSSFAQHFATKRPVIGLCLKRYAWTAQGQATRIATKVEIPLEIPLPQFVSDDEMDASAPVYGNFKLVLKSAVCHRGKSVQSGHYVALVRGDDNPEGDAGRWLRFDDLAPERVTYVDHQKAFDEETPYLLFYQVTPIGGEPEGSGLADGPISGRTSSTSLSSSLGEKKLMMPEIFAPTPEEARTPPPEYSATPPLTPGLRPTSRGFLEPEAAERGRSMDGKTDGPPSRKGSRLFRGFSREGKDSSAGHGRSASISARERGSIETSRERSSAAEKREKRSSLPSLSLMTGRKSYEFRRDLREEVEVHEAQKNGKVEKPLKKSKSKDSPTWGERMWGGILGGGDKDKDKDKEKEKDKKEDRDKDRDKDKARVKEDVVEVGGDVDTFSTANTVGSTPSLAEVAVATGSSTSDGEKDKAKAKGKEKDKGKEKEKDKEGGSWKRLSKALGLSGKGDKEKAQKGESSKSAAGDKDRAQDT